MIEHSFWYASRAGGIAAYLLLSLSTIWGLALSTRLGDRLLGKVSLFEAHRVTSLLALAFTAVHILVLLADDYMTWSVAGLLLPFAAPYRPLATTLGVISLYTTALVTASFYVRGRIGYRAWKRIHYAAFLAYFGATLHGITAGTDTREPWAILLYAASLGVVVFLVNLRILGGAATPRTPIVGDLSSRSQLRHSAAREG